MRALSMDAPLADLRSALTTEQEQAVARRQGPLLLAAGAGSGKTSVLVERFVRAVREDGIAPGRILAITFTERAAGELRERVRARLLELGERQAASDTEGAAIGTFHGFCARLLRIHALSAGLDPDFTILDESNAERLRRLAFRGALAGLLAETGIRAGGACLPASVETGIRAGGACLPASVEGECPPASVGGECLPASAGELRERAVELLAAYGADRVRGMVLGVYAEQRSRGASLPTLPDPAHSLPTSDLPHRPDPASQLTDPMDHPQPDPPASQPDKPQSQPDSPESQPGGSQSQSDPLVELEALRACAVLGEVLERFGRGYAELKEARSALDFDDLELRARDLLESHPGVRRMWAERLELLMVDEFQDTNRRQLALLGLLERGNLLTVGDELQSIYGFRHAEVEIIRERHRELAARGEAIALVRNFRGRPPLIAAVNSVFAERFGEAYTPLIPAREETDGGEPLIELLLTDRSGWASSPHAHAIAGELPAATLWRQAEARLLAQRVAELVAGGQAAAGDVAVLLRAAGDLPVYERALEERGLRTLAAVGSFWGHQQVGDLLAWLHALANPLDELALYSALASPLVGISSDGLALVALRARAEGSGAWAAIAHGEGDLYVGLSAPDRERLLRFAERFAAERRVAGARGAAELLLRALSHSGYERHVLSLPWGERRLANIHKLLRLARRHEAAEGPDLRGFLDRVAERGALAESSEPHAPTGSEPDAVRLLTVHAAKGLEFPVVCLADLGRTGNGAPPDLLVDETRIGLRLARLDGSPPAECLRYEELSQERRHAEAREEERIVYVAMTRARERLLLSGAADFERWPAPRPGGAPIAWLGPALAPELPELARTLERPVAELAMGSELGLGDGVAGALGGEGDGFGERGMGEGGARDVGAKVRCWLNAPGTVGEVLREESLRPGRA
ncbi:MAG TPA: UvrD-helicase domain-containing protein, partial [Solirubrobacteraceae bacterium]|nr:UvrD-helicase domain-containing protein [Solirubrobacteraceae bacterium]